MKTWTRRSGVWSWLVVVALALPLAACGADYTAQSAPDPIEAVDRLPASPRAEVADPYIRPSAPDPIEAIDELPPVPSSYHPAARYAAPSAPDPVEAIEADWLP
jgi:hypothetical protein